MATFGLRHNGRRLAAVDDYQFPSGVRHRFVQRHSDLTGDGIRAVEAAARQWFRLGVRHPRARLVMPSVIVDELTREFVLHTREYAEFCAALGRVSQRAPEPAVTAENRSGALQATFRYAQQDEPGGAASLPVLFRVDHELAVTGGRHYLADCGGRGICYELKGSICLRHVGGFGKPTGRGTWSLKRTHPPGDISGGNGYGGGGGCGGGF